MSQIWPIHRSRTWFERVATLGLILMLKILTETLKYETQTTIAEVICTFFSSKTQTIADETEEVSSIF